MKNADNKMNKQIIVLSVVIMLSLSFTTLVAQVRTPEEYYKEMQKKLASGWNTWNTRSVLSHVFLPECFTVNLELNDLKSGSILKEALIGRRGKDVENVTPGPHSYNGSYTELTVDWKNIEVNVKTAAEGKNLAVIVTPIKGKESGKLMINPKIIWGEKGKVEVAGDGFVFHSNNTELKFYISTKEKISFNDSTITCALNGRIIVSTYADKNESEIETLVNLAGKKT